MHNSNIILPLTYYFSILIEDTLLGFRPNILDAAIQTHAGCQAKFEHACRQQDKQGKVRHLDDGTESTTGVLDYVCTQAGGYSTVCTFMPGSGVGMKHVIAELVVKEKGAYAGGGAAARRINASNL